MTIFNYTLNAFDAVIVALVLVLTVVGAHRGLLVNVLNFIRWSLGTLLCFAAGSYAGPIVYEHYVKPRAMAYVTQKIVTSDNLDEVLQNLQQMQQQMPKALGDMLNLNNLTIDSGDIAQSVMENTLQPFLLSLTKAGVFLAVFLVFFLLTGIILLLIKRRNRKKDKEGASKLRKTDKALGAVLGLIKSAVIVLALCAVVNFAVQLTEDAAQPVKFLEYIKASSLYNLICEINPFNAITEGLI